MTKLHIFNILMYKMHPKFNFFFCFPKPIIFKRYQYDSKLLKFRIIMTISKQIIGIKIIVRLKYLRLQS